MSTTNGGTMLPLQGITEQDIADYLVNTPGFFERHAEVLHTVQLTSPHSHRAVSLQQRQMEMLRDRIKGLELRIMDMVRHGQDNLLIADRVHRWAQVLLAHEAQGSLPQVLVDALRHEFLVPQASLKLWSVRDDLADELPAWAQGASDDACSLARSLTQPFCGPNAGFETASWLEGQAGPVISMAMVPLRQAGDEPEATFGLLVLGSPDPTRFTADMGTEFLSRIGAMASAALARLCDRPGHPAQTPDPTE